MTSGHKRRKLPETKELQERAAHAVADLANAAVAHHDEIEAIVTQYRAMKTALAEAVKTIDWLHVVPAAERWTPADGALLEQWRELAK